MVPPNYNPLRCIKSSLSLYLEWSLFRGDFDVWKEASISESLVVIGRLVPIQRGVIHLLGESRYKIEITNQSISQCKKKKKKILRVPIVWLHLPIFAVYNWQIMLKQETRNTVEHFTIYNLSVSHIQAP